MNRLLNYHKKGEKQIHVKWCRICLHGFQKQEAYKAHVAVCMKNIDRTTLYTMPKEKLCQFTDWSKTINKKFVVYADFESILPEDSKYFQRHEPIAAGAVFLKEGNILEYINFVGANCVYEFLLWIEDITVNIVYPWYDENSKEAMLPLTAEEENSFIQSCHCYLCGSYCIELKHDHDHFNGKYLGPACNGCNLARKVRPSLEVVFHNLKGYDMHHLLKYALSRFKWGLKPIVLTSEKFLAMTAYIGKKNC